MTAAPTRESQAAPRENAPLVGLPDGLVIEAAADRALTLMWLNNQKPLTRAAYATDIRGFFALVAKPLADVTMADMQGYARSLETQGFKPATQARKIAAVKSLYTMGCKLCLLVSNPTVLVKRPVGKDDLQQRIVSQSAVQLMIDREPDARNKLLLRVLYAGGLRRTELCALVWGDLKARGKGGELTLFGKGSKTRTVTIGHNLWREVAALRAGARPEDPVFRTRLGTPLDKSQVHRAVKRAAKRVGLPEQFSAHWLRHAHASHALDNGANVHEVQKTLGHASLNTTTRYSHAKRSSSDFLRD